MLIIKELVNFVISTHLLTTYIATQRAIIHYKFATEIENQETNYKQL